MPGAARAAYFRVVDRIRRGEVSPQEILATAGLFDNHFHDSPAWWEFLAGGASNPLISVPSAENG